MRQPVRRDRELDRRLCGAGLRQHPRDAPDRGGMGRRRLDQVGHHQVAGLRAVARLGRDHHPVADAAVVRLDEADPCLEPEAAGHLTGAPLQHLDQRTLAPAARIEPADAHRGPVAMHQLAHLAEGQEHIVPAAIRTEEAESVPMAGDRAHDQREAVEQQILLRAVQEQLAVAQHRAEALGQRLAHAGLAHFQPLAQRIEAERLARLRQRLEDELAARDRVLVTARLFSEPGVPVLPA